jgi:hypothetical protein
MEDIFSDYEWHVTAQYLMCRIARLSPDIRENSCETGKRLMDRDGVQVV